MAGELLEFTGGTYGMVLNLEEDNVGLCCSVSIHILKKAVWLREREQLCLCLSAKPCWAGSECLVSSIDGKGPINTDTFRPVERVAPGWLNGTG